MPTSKKRITGYVSEEVHKLFIVYCKALNLSESKAIESLLRSALSGDTSTLLKNSKIEINSEALTKQSVIDLCQEIVSQSITLISERIEAIETELKRPKEKIDIQDEVFLISKENVPANFSDQGNNYIAIATLARLYSLNRPTLSKWLSGKQQPQSENNKTIFADIKKKYNFLPGKGFLPK